MIYFIYDKVNKAIKIGRAGDPKRRLTSLQIGSVSKLTMLGILPGDAREEGDLHRRFASDRIRGEWFRESPAILSYIESSSAEHLAPFMELADLEPRLLDLLYEARSFKPAPKFCANEVWYGYRGSGFPGIKPRLSQLVGWFQSSGGKLRTKEAYDIAYEAIYGALPHCQPGCSCQVLMEALLNL